MTWKNLLREDTEKALPWFGFRKVHDSQRTWIVEGPKPAEHGWYLFKVGARRYCTLLGEAELDPDYMEGQWVHRGYLVGNHLVPDGYHVDTNPDRFVEQTRQVHCVPSGLDRIARAIVVADRAGQLVFMSQDFPLGPEVEVTAAYLDRLPDVSHISGVIPSLDLAFRWVSHQRTLAEERQRELEVLREQERQRREREAEARMAMRDASTSIGRRTLAPANFTLAATMALQVSGAELLDARDSARRDEKIVQFRFRLQRFECVVDRQTLRVVDAGICLTDELTGEKGDTLFTLESLPGVIGEAIDRDCLVVYRHLR